MGTYNWMPAGLCYENKGGLGVYVKYKKNPDRISLKWHDANHIYVVAPDRDIFIVRNTHNALPLYPAESFDEFFALDIFHHEAYQDNRVPFYMVNFTDYFGNPDGGSNVRRSIPRQEGSYVVSDSGGHQIAVGVCDYVDPQALVTWYNKNVDIGLIIDIPCNPQVIGQDVFVQLAKLQKRNTDVMLANKTPSLELMNIFHGTSDEDVKRFRDITETDKIERLAVGGLVKKGLVPTLNKFYSTILQGNKYKHYHALGILNPAVAILLARISRHERVTTLTSDSSSPIQVAVTGGYYVYNTMDRPFDVLPVGYMGNFNYPSTRNLLPCGCPVCSAIKYTDVFGVLGRSILFEVLIYHNIHVAMTYTCTLNSVIDHLDYKGMRQFAAQHFRDKKILKDLQLGINFMEDVDNTGYQATKKKYAFYLKQNSFAVASGSMFDQGESRTEEPTLNRKRALEIIKLYEKGIGKQTKQSQTR